MPRDRRYHTGGGKDLTPLIYGIGEAISPTEENPFYNKKPGEVPYDMKVDPNALVAKPFKGFLSSRENTDAAQERLAQEGRTKQEQIRRTQMIAENTAEEARKREMLKQAGLTALLEFKNATGVSDPTPMSAADPYVREALFGSRGGVEGMVGSAPRLAATIGRLPYETDIGHAQGGRERQETEVARIAAEDNPAMIRDATLAGYQKPVLMNEAAQQEIDMRNAGKFAWGHTPIRGLTMTGPKEFISPTPETHAGFQPTVDANGKQTYAFVPGQPSFPMGVVQLPDGTLVTTGGPQKPKPATPPPTPAPAAGPGFISRSTPPLSLTPSAFNPSPIPARGVIPAGINAMTADLNRSAIEQQSQLENLTQDPFGGLRDIRDFYWMPAGAGEAPVIRHSPLALPPEVERAKRSRGLLPQY